MIKIMISICGFLIMAVSAEAQCVGEFVTAKIDAKAGNVIVETRYTVNGQVIPVSPDVVGRTRYNETSGTIDEIKVKIDEDIAKQCEYLIAKNKIDIIENERLLKQQELVQPIVDNFNATLSGHKVTVDKYIENFKGKEITVNADGTTSVRTVTAGPVADIQ